MERAIFRLYKLEYSKLFNGCTIVNSFSHLKLTLGEVLAFHTYINGRVNRVFSSLQIQREFSVINFIFKCYSVTKIMSTLKHFLPGGNNIGIKKTFSFGEIVKLNSLCHYRIPESSTCPQNCRQADEVFHGH